MSDANASVIGDGRAKWKIGDVPLARAGVRKRADLVAEILVDGEGVELRVVSGRAQDVAHPARAVPDGVAAVRRGDPLVDDHGPGVPGSVAAGRAR